MAIVQETKVIPTKTITENKIVCDECGSKAWTKCTECRADLCQKHRHYSPNDCGGDYTDYVCASCLEIINSYQPAIEELENQIDDVKASCNNLCRTKRKIKNETNKT